jgi:hypothetical protein
MWRLKAWKKAEGMFKVTLSNPITLDLKKQVQTNGVACLKLGMK